MASDLAILGGQKTVTVSVSERWKRPIEKEKELIYELLEKGEITGEGAGISKIFEDEFKEYIGCDYCLVVSHGHLALASAYYAAGVGPGDEIITPSAGYIGSYAGALHMGARPVFSEIDPHTLLMDPEDVEKRITYRTRAINPVHMNGNVCDMDSFIDMGRRHGIPIVEDAAHAAGCEWGGKKIGNVGDIAAFSLQGVNPGGKPVAGGEGGVVCTNDRRLYERALIYCHLHRKNIVNELTLPEYRGLDAEVLGLKFRAHPLALAVALVSLRTLPYRMERAIENREKLFNGLRKIEGIEPVKSYPKARWHGLYRGWPIIIHPNELDGISPVVFQKALRAEGVPIKGHGWASGHLGEHLRNIFTRGFDLWGHGRGPLDPIHGFMGLPPFKPYKLGDYPITEDLAKRVFILRPYIDPDPKLIDQIIEAFKKVVENRKELLKVKIR
ncbi:MAG: hypothetical protein DRJ64_05060 [Thermoprotei archaeon]|nr:MAG: hypothetical protein DRJ64_05060 [Thermoprotei archaeon]